MSLLFEQSVFGPITSRRFGRSLGINLLPSDGKICNFECTYCECGNTEATYQRKRFPTAEEVLTSLSEELDHHLNDLDRISVVTFAGNGEPTLHPEFHSLVPEIKSMVADMAPEAKLVLLSNGTTWNDPKIQETLALFDVLQVKFDPFIEEMNRPKMPWDAANIVQLLQNFPLAYQIQSMLLKSKHNAKVDASNSDLLNDWIAQLECLTPEKVVLYTVDREAAEHGIEALNYKELEKVEHQLRSRGLNTEIVY